LPDFHDFPFRQRLQAAIIAWSGPAWSRVPPPRTAKVHYSRAGTRRLPGSWRTTAMVTTARDRLARTLRGDAETAVSVELTAGTGDLSLAVEGFGPVGFPVTAAKARRLASLGQPARFGRGEQTLTDPDVRDTWEIPKHLVRAEWNGAALQAILATAK